MVVLRTNRFDDKVERGCDEVTAARALPVAIDSLGQIPVLVSRLVSGHSIRSGGRPVLIKVDEVPGADRGSITLVRSHP